MNKATLHGFTGKDPEVRTLESGKKIVKFTFATSESYTDNSGNRQSNTEWHNIIAWDKLAELCEKYVKKGSELILEGKITYRTYEDKEGVTKYFTEIVCKGLEFCGKKEDKAETTEPAEEKWHGKKEVESMSNPDELPGSDDELSNLPF